MFAADRWAQAFMNVCAGAQEEGLAVFQAFADGIRRARIGSGSGAEKRFEKLVRDSLGAAPQGAAAAACRTLALLLRKGMSRHIPAVAREARKLWEAQNGILNATLDSAFPPEADFTDALAAALREKTAAREVRLKLRLMPDLIGGCRLYMGSECLDASVRGQLKKMAADLHAAGGIQW